MLYVILKKHAKIELEEPDLKSVVEDYWIVEPFIKAIIYEEDFRFKYYALEPTLSLEELRLLSSIMSELRRILSLQDVSLELEERAKTLFRNFKKITDEYGVVFEGDLYSRMLYYLFREFFGYSIVEPFMRDENIEDISCNGYDIPIYVYHRKYGNLETNIRVPKEMLDKLVLFLVQKSGKHVSLARPIIDSSLPDGSRIQATYGTEVTPRGSSFTIRKFTTKPLTPLDLIKLGTIPLGIVAYLWLAVEHKLSIIVVGETASGKTTTLNAITMFIPPDAKVVSIEDTREIKLHHENWIAEVTRTGIGEQEIDMYELLRAALRQRPDYIIVGEIRGREALTLFQAMATGHASYSTFHAGDVMQMIYRFESDPLRVPRSMLQFLDVVLVQNMYIKGPKRFRKTKEVNEIIGIDPVDKNLLINQFVKYEAVKDVHVEVSVPKKLEKIAEKSYDVYDELLRRKKYLEAMLKMDIKDYKEFTTLINAYYRNPEEAYARVVK